MVLELQRQWGRLRTNRRKVMATPISMWEELNWYLDRDERLVSPETYLNNRQLYDDIRNVVYIVRDRKYPEAGLEWVIQPIQDRRGTRITSAIAKSCLFFFFPR